MGVVDSGLILLSGIGCALSYQFYVQSALGKPINFAAASVLIALIFGLLLAVQGGYRLRNIGNVRQQWRITFTAWTGVFALLLALAFAMKVSDEFSRGTTISFYFVGLTALLIWKSLAAYWISTALRNDAFANARAIVIAEFGLSSTSSAMADLGRLGFHLVQVIEIRPRELASPLLLSSLASRFDQIVAFARENEIEHIFLLMDWGRRHAIDSILDALKILPIPVHLVPDPKVAQFLRYPLVGTGGTWTVELRRTPLNWNERASKRVIDVLGASVGLLVFAPVMLLTAGLVKLTSQGPVLFCQTRNGFNGRAFRILKFRTMRVLEDGPTIIQATRNDSRVTSIGRWLRKTSIDELPQLLNVLLGDMSLVGPRPHAAAHNSEYEKLIGNYAFRHHVKPGITGWAQINGYRGETSTIDMMARRVEFDLWYINNWSMALDLSILFRTLLVAFGRPSAY
ncbi:undecaprenyl-phosphate glucose phosphotransferase [Bradyrhizobium sp. WBOS4]|nr:undecaprenyl-phosphate glucose phosphotransferase [Bradyrhizobium sp. WBOS8]MDD1582481.1 undecaprenyl-phosphate glucose phosphotransferase [Bradyrhizobium sp. WBOS4]UUO50873.1 undecaprenyl-phosphate glucose phosphotransferase [Bradyrhizobium sp. WBOS04]UUO58252.1 undecaprenyl-phosphate glucose phosphotransferase [Bradyrhizobium sp. WBOS08]